MRPVCSGAIYASVPAIISGGKGGVVFAGQLRCDPESGEPDIVGVVDEHIRRLDVLMDQPLQMELVKGCRQANGYA